MLRGLLTCAVCPWFAPRSGRGYGRKVYTVTFAKYWKTSLVFVAESVFEIHCSTEGPYRQLYMWDTEMRYSLKNRVKHYYWTQIKPMQLIM
jgi:hypothetical protein